MDTFRDGSDGGTPLVGSGDLLAGGNGLGLVQVLPRGEVSARREVECVPASITAMDVEPVLGTQCLVAFDSAISLRSFPDVQQEIKGLLGRRTLDITQVTYDYEGKHW